MSQTLARKINAAFKAASLPYVAIFQPAEDETVDDCVIIKCGDTETGISASLDSDGAFVTANEKGYFLPPDITGIVDRVVGFTKSIKEDATNV